MPTIMPSLFDTRSHLTDIDSTRMGHVLTNVLVVGSGVAGCRAAVEASTHGSVTLITKGRFEESATRFAQGGIAASLAPNDSPQAHLDDTLRVGRGLCDARAVQMLVQHGAERIEELVAWGLEFDRVANHWALTREGGHSVDRVIHAQGDQTGRALAETLKRRVARTENVRVFEHCYLLDLVVLGGVCVGAVTFHRRHGHQLIWAKQTILASGGCGQLWRETTNPSVATGDGLAAAFRAGAVLRDLELMQFHPTTLYVAGSGRALISEAVRGEGAYLIDREGNRFIQDYHCDGELAPRDVVSRAIHTHLGKTKSNCVYLDVRHMKGFESRFPHIAQLCADFQVDIHKTPIPVRPSAHYMVGGIIVALDGSSSLDGLLACGEVASTGVHGANRMASNSLLEGLVYGKLVGATAGQRAIETEKPPSIRRLSVENETSERTDLDLVDIRNSLRSLMWRNVGIVRRQQRLVETCEILDFWAHFTLDKTFDDLPGWETQNLLTVGKLVAMSAAERKESLGVHFREDAPTETDGPLYHTHVQRDQHGTAATRSSEAPNQNDPSGRRAD